MWLLLGPVPGHSGDKTDPDPFTELPHEQWGQRSHAYIQLKTEQ